MTKSKAIKKLHQQDRSQREIAEALGLDRKTVRRHLKEDSTSDPTCGLACEDSKGNNSPTGSDAPGRTTMSASACELFKGAIEQMLQLGLHAHQDR